LNTFSKQDISGGGAGSGSSGQAAAIVLVAAIAWIWVAATNWEMPAGWSSDICRTQPGAPWETRDFLDTAGMWLIMMVAMMSPTVLPWALALRKSPARQDNGDISIAVAPAFVAGYLIAWSVFSILASLVQWQLASRGLLTSAMLIEDRRAGALVLLAVGAYQWTPLKDACLKHCASPVAYFLTHWHEGSGGAALLGFQHGLYCVGCCWLLMFFMLLVGAMNLFWMALVSAYVLVEMYVSRMRWVSKVVGGVAVLFGLAGLIAT